MTSRYAAVGPITFRTLFLKNRKVEADFATCDDLIYSQKDDQLSPVAQSVLVSQHAIHTSLFENKLFLTDEGH